MNNYNDEYNILDRVPRLSVPYQIGGTCAYHAVTTVLESRYRVRLMRNARNPDDFPRLACQYLVDFVPKGKNKKKQIFNYTTKVGIISVDDYSAIGMRGENLWIPSSYRRKHYRVKTWKPIPIQPPELALREVKKEIRDGALYMDFTAKTDDLNNRNLRYIEGVKHRTTEEYENDKDVVAHSVAIIGYGRRIDNGEKYYIFSNSYGPDWASNTGTCRVACHKVTSIYVPVLEALDEVHEYTHNPRRSLEVVHSGTTSSGAGSSGAGPSGTSGAGPSRAGPSGSGVA